ncbi:MAG: hypothetical protein LBQ50_02735 [Planctomycetaceae bacterium]|jgi:hypothetical protein|nr:hypothetical protein [Planctomycetaceae bacterium]
MFFTKQFSLAMQYNTIQKIRVYCKSFFLKRIKYIPTSISLNLNDIVNFIIGLFFYFCVCSINIASEQTVNLEVLKEIKEYKVTYGFSPNDEDFYTSLAKIGQDRINKRDFIDLLNEILSQQRPLIPKKELLKLFASKRAAIHDYQIIFNHNIFHYSADGKVLSTEKTEREYTSSGNKLLFDIRSQSPKYYVPHQRKSYDGKNIISLMEPRIAKEIDIPPQVGIGSAKNLDVFFMSWMPLGAAMLFDTKKCNFPHEGFDIILFLNDSNVDIYEKKEIINGFECIVAASLTRRIYLAINYDFSVIRKEEFRQVHVPSPANNEPVLIGRELILRSTLTDLKNYENGIWLPSKIEVEIFDKKGSLEKREEIVSSLIKINQGIDDNYFIDFIPEDAIITDTSRGIIYNNNDNASIDGLLKETVKSKRVFIYRYISIIAGFAMIFIVLALKYRTYLKNKKEHESKMEETE